MENDKVPKVKIENDDNPCIPEFHKPVDIVLCNCKYCTIQLALKLGMMGNFGDTCNGDLSQGSIVRQIKIEFFIFLCQNVRFP